MINNIGNNIAGGRMIPGNICNKFVTIKILNSYEMG